MGLQGLVPEASDVVIVIYDLRDPDQWRAAHRHRNYWGKTHTRVHYLEENVVVLAFHPAQDEGWRPWELVRLSWILGEDLEERAA
jgi:hypothetical protein